MSDDAQVVANYHGIEVLQAPMLSPGMIRSLNEGTYERREVACGLAAIPKGARLLELGAGAGVVGSVLHRNLACTATFCVEANPDLVPFIERVHRHNALGENITVHHAVVLSDPAAPNFVTFNVAGNFLGSSLHANPNKNTRQVQVPVLRYDVLKKNFPHDAIMMDIEGGELDFLRHADLSGVNVLITEMHRDIYGREGMRECRRLLEAKGMAFDESSSKVGVHVYLRT